jgi:glycosyltransferase involved in cell wall biosynthesis
MRIALAVLRYLPSVGGSARVVQLLAEGMVHRGNDVTLITQEEPGCPPEETISGVRVVRIPMRHLNGYRLPIRYLRTLRKLDADVFHVHGNRIWCVDYYLPFAGWFRWPQVITAHGFYHYWMRPGAARRVYYDGYFARRIRRFDRYVALTAGEANHVLSWRYPAERLRVIPNGIDTSEFARPPSRDRETVRESWRLGTKRVAIYVGGFYDNKRVDRLVQAVADTRGEWGLVVIGTDRRGDRGDRESCGVLATATRAPVVFTGEVDRQTVLDSFAAADAYVQGSQFEGFGLTLLEAMAADLPFVAFDAGAARELAGTGAGRIVGSPLEMTGELLRLDSWRKPGAGRNAVAKWSAGAMIDDHLKLYRSIARNGGAP